MTVPIAVAPRTGRLGIGKDAEERQLKRKRELEVEELLGRQIQQQEGMTEEFAERMRERFKEQRIGRLVKECRLVCEQLDKETVRP